MGAPRYVDPNEVIAWLTNKVTFDLVASLPQPSTVVDNGDGTFNLTFATRPANYRQLYNGANGSVVSQGDPTTGPNGDYLGLTSSGYGIVVGNVLGTFTTSGGVLALSGNPNAITLPLLYSKIAIAEAKVENDFRRLYITPFQGIDGATYLELPPSTYDWLNNMFLLQCCIQILSTGWSKSDGVRGQDYTDEYKKMYYEEKNIMYTRARTGDLLTQPLPNLLMNTGVVQFDRMPAPIISNDNVSAVSFAKARQTNPAVTPWFYGRWGYPNRAGIPWLR